MSYGNWGLTRCTSRRELRSCPGGLREFKRAHARLARAGERGEVERGAVETLAERTGAVRGLDGKFVRRVTVIR